MIFSIYLRYSKIIESLNNQRDHRYLVKFRSDDYNHRHLRILPMCSSIRNQRMTVLPVNNKIEISAEWYSRRLTYV